MSFHRIKNFDQLNISPQRKLVLKIVEKGLECIDTETIVKNNVRLERGILKIQNFKRNLKDFKKIFVIGFGKASAKAALALEQILGDFITGGVVISAKTADTKKIKSLLGTHPLPSFQNVKAAEEIAAMIEGITENDLVINLISGGGSALLCWDELEMEQGTELYQNFLKTGQDIKILNTVRKHISKVKGGGLAKMLYPATVVSLIFSDVAGNNYHFVDSGPTYFDQSTMYDAKSIVEKYDLGAFRLNETPKEKKYFAKVHNIPVLSNGLALEVMKNYAEELGLEAKIVSAELFETAQNTLAVLSKAANKGGIVLAGSEIKLSVPENAGKGGRNQYLGLTALNFLGAGDCFASIASDGLDNSDCAGVIVDQSTKDRAKTLELNSQNYLKNFDSYSFFERLGCEQIFTGPTEANVSDFLLWLRN